MQVQFLTRIFRADVLLNLGQIILLFSIVYAVIYLCIFMLYKYNEKLNQRVYSQVKDFDPNSPKWRQEEVKTSLINSDNLDSDPSVVYSFTHDNKTYTRTVRRNKLPVSWSESDTEHVVYRTNRPKNNYLLSEISVMEENNNEIKNSNHNLLIALLGLYLLLLLAIILIYIVGLSA